jgi:hypothetical protein
MDRTDISSFLTGAAELGSVAVFVTMVLIWADAIGVS